MTRACGTCAMCCKIMEIRELDSPNYEWCPHCPTHRGCTIYKQRPQSCADYLCLWLMDDEPDDEHKMFKESDRPDMLKSMFEMVDMREQNLGFVIKIWESYPGASEKKRTKQLIDQLLTQNFNVAIINKDSQMMIRARKERVGPQ